MRDRIKIVLATVMVFFLGSFALFNLINLAFYGEIMVRHRQGWTSFIENPVGFVIAVIWCSVMCVLVFGGFALKLYFIPKERDARKRWENRPRFEDESPRIYVKPVDPKRD